MGWIYILVNTINGKVYIGKWTGKRIEHRRDQHKRGQGNQHLYRAIQKYGWENFILTHCMKMCLKRNWRNWKLRKSHALTAIRVVAVGDITKLMAVRVWWGGSIDQKQLPKYQVKTIIIMARICRVKTIRCLAENALNIQSG